MSVTVGQIKAETLEILNLSKGTSYGTHDGDPQIKDALVNDAVWTADEDVARLICSTPGHPRRNHKYEIAPNVGVLVFKESHTFLYTNNGTAFYHEIPASDSGLTNVKIRLNASNFSYVSGVPAPADRITRWQQYGTLGFIEGFYDVSENRLVFTGLELRADTYKVPARDRSTYLAGQELFTPEVYRSAVVMRALYYLCMKSEEWAQAASFYAAQFESAARLIVAGGQITSPAEVYQQKR